MIFVMSSSFQELPEQWENLKKVTALVKQTVAPLQINEVTVIRRKAATFDVRLLNIMVLILVDQQIPYAKI